MEDAKSILTRWGRMVSDRRPWDSVWKDVADFAMPRKGGEFGGGTNGTGQRSNVFDSTAIESAAILAAGHASAITPAGAKWFAWEAPEEIKSDEADAWYAKASEIALKTLAAGNFHTVMNEAFEDRASFGLCCLGAMEDPLRTLTFQVHPVGSFCIEEDEHSNVDTFFFRDDRSIRQLHSMFGDEVIAGHEKLSESWNKFREKGESSDFHVIHAVFPRLQFDESKRDALNMPIASVWTLEDDKSILRRSGFPEMPYMASRFLRRTGANQQYGYSPFERVRADIHNANMLRKLLRVHGMKIAVPPLLVPDYLMGQVDTRPGGLTAIKSGQATLPQGWLDRSDASGLLEQLQDTRQTIRNAYHTDLFKMFSEREKQMTAREVTELAAEKLMPFSPSFSRFTSDMQPFMERIFAILFRAGKFGPMNSLPKAVIARRGNLFEVPPPRVIYQSRVALAIRQTETAAADRMLERAIAISQVYPNAVDNMDFDEFMRLTGRNDGVPEAVITTEKARQKIRDARAEQQQQQQQMEQIGAAADAAGKVGLNMNT